MALFLFVHFLDVFFECHGHGRRFLGRCRDVNFKTRFFSSLHGRVSKDGYACVVLLEFRKIVEQDWIPLGLKNTRTS